MPLVVATTPVLTSQGLSVERCYYTDAYGRVTDLTTQPDNLYKAGVDGRFMPPVQHISETVPQRDGERYRSSRVVPRAITIPLTMVADDTTHLRAKVRNLAQGLNPKRGPGTLTVETLDGIRRYVTCAYEAGMESGVDGNNTGVWQDIAITFRAWDPFWYDIVPVMGQWALTAGSVTFFPLLPVRLGPSAIVASIVQHNAGDIEAWPLWTISGPGTSLTLANETTGQSLVVSTLIGVGSSVIIDTRPGAKTILGSDGTNLFPYVSGSMWPLEVGDNTLTVEMPNAAEGAVIGMTFAQGYLGV